MSVVSRRVSDVSSKAIPEGKPVYRLAMERDGYLYVLAGDCATLREAGTLANKYHKLEDNPPYGEMFFPLEGGPMTEEHPDENQS